LVEDSANPDATPFVIDASGNVVVGSTTAPLVNLGTAGQFSLVAVGGPISQTISRFSANSSGPTQIFFKGRGLTSSDFAVVSSGDTLANLLFYGADGTQGISAASITASVDGTPGTNDMPGRLVFSTTADGASSPTERMRIDSAGQVGIGATPSASVSLDVSKVVGIGGSTGYGIWSRGSAAPTTTTNASSYASTVSTSSNGGVGYTVGALVGFRAIQGTLNADSTVTNQFGFRVESSLTGATNNFGFSSNIASGTGRWNFYAEGTAANYFAGQTLIGNTTSTDAGVNLLISSATGSATPTPTEFRIQSTTNAGDWSTSLPWGRLSFYASDTSGSGPKIHAAIDVVAAASVASASALSFKTSSGGADTLTEQLVIKETSAVGAVVELKNAAGLQIARTAVTSPAATDGNVFSGTYTPTLTNVTNVASSTAVTCQYMRVGNVVTVSGQVSITATAGAAATVLDMSLPIASAFTLERQAGGVFSNGGNKYGRVAANATDDRFSFSYNAPDASVAVMFFNVTYQVI
jgi:hypothetical protein